ncbi:hypothetical protein Q9R19_01775 [Microbacterium sp. ARD32]|uniref:hypothetical protein n=1 Tax=Microbacterium sp. ARD32 TaxID=2962577 RepID=UPI0028826033|nr:hypothetical protein [Microbacterium sp. ARD32]MDT0156344.1 hypothetical protein [Microbacterium sp. ARD32]
MDGNPLRLLALLVIGLNVALAVWLLFRRDSRWAMVLWGAALFFTPVYVNFTVQGVTLTILDAVTIVAIAASMLDTRWQWSIIDALMGTAVLCIFVSGMFGAVPGHITYTVVSWVLPYIWGRIVVARVGFEWVASCITVAAVLAALLAIIEFLTGENLFVQLPGVAGAMWTNLQYRGGLLRAEGAFGHSISLGSSLAISTAFAIAVPWHLRWKIPALVTIAVGAVMTVSRIGMVGILLVVGFSLLFLGRYVRRAHRLAVVAITAVGLLIALPFIATVFDDAGSEASGSAEYRADLVPLIRDMVAIGISPAREVSADGADYYGGFRSIDSALILTGLRHGLLPLAIFILMLGICAWVVVTGKGNPAAVAVLSQVPALATVALITQYAPFVWFVAGVAVTSYSLETRRGSAGAPETRRLAHRRILEAS